MTEPGSSDPWKGQRRAPPKRGVSAEPAVEGLRAGMTLWRIHGAGAPPSGFSTRAPDEVRGGRFDSPGGAPGVLYACDSVEGAIAEVLLRDVPLHDERVRAVLGRQVLGRVLTLLDVTRDLSVVSLHGAGAAAVAQGLWLTKSESCDYPLTRDWGAALRTRAPQTAGFVWRARHDEDRLAYALYEDGATDALRPRLSLVIDEGPGLEAVRRVLLEHRAVIEG